MVFSKSDLDVIEACFTEKGWRGKRICREFPSKGWNPKRVNYAIRRFENTGSFDRKKGSGRPITATSDENQQLVEDLVLSQESEPGTHLSTRKVARRIGISNSSVSNILKKKGLKSVKRFVTPNMKPCTKQHRFEKSKRLVNRFSNSQVRKMVFQDEKDFTLEVPLNRQNNRCYTPCNKADISEVRLYHPTNKMSLKLMVSCVVSWNGVSRPFFLDPQKAKVTGQYYTNHLKKDLIPECKKLYPQDDFIFAQDGATSHTSNVCQEYLRNTLGTARFVNKFQWPPRSPDCNPLDYYFWSKLSEVVYEEKRPFQNLES